MDAIYNNINLAKRIKPYAIRKKWCGFILGPMKNEMQKINAYEYVIFTYLFSYVVCCMFTYFDAMAKENTKNAC